MSADAELYQATQRMRVGGFFENQLLLQQVESEASSDDRSVGVVDDPVLAAYLVETHNAYVGAVTSLIGLLHADALPKSWESTERGPVSLTEVITEICKHLPTNSVGDPERAEDWDGGR